MSDDKVSEVKSKKGESSESWVVGIEPDRIMTLVDGVFAIAMTILVLELAVPFLDEEGALRELGVELYSFYMSFIALGVYWILHHYIFHFIKRSDGVLVWLNIHFLIFAVLVPFAFKLNLANLNIPTAMAIASLFFIITISILIIILQYAVWDHRLVDRDVDMRTVNKLNFYMILAIIGAVLSTFVAYINHGLGSLILLVVLLILIGATAHARHGQA